MILPQIVHRNPAPTGAGGPFGGNRSVHEFFAKIARHAFGKGAAFCYAVAVTVSGQLAYSYLQPRDPAPALFRAPPSGAVAVAPVSGATPTETARLPGHRAAPASIASAPVLSIKPASAPSAATAPILPEPLSASLPSPAASPVPAAKPATAPPSRHPAASVHGTGPGIAPEAVVEPSSAPVEPAGKPSVSVTVKPAPPADMPPPPFHFRAAETSRAAQDPDADVAAPIPLLPPEGTAETEKTALPVIPGPGSGGLY